MKINAIRTVALFLVFMLTLPAFWGCKRETSASYYGYFNTEATISDFSGGSAEQFDQACRHFRDRLEYYHKLFDIYNEYDGINNVATVNRLAGKEAVKVDSELIEFLEYSKEMYKLTGGETNIAMGSVLSIWHDYREEGKRVPEASLLSSAAEHTDINNLIIDRENSTVYLSDGEMSLDVGAIAKGYAVEKIADSLRSYGISSYVIDVGGNICAIGAKKDGSSWRIGVTNPDIQSAEKYVYYFNITDSSVVTSGDYQRYYTVDGVKYHHIIDADTLMPSAHFTSVTVKTKSSALADALSTALFNMDYESGRKLVSGLSDVFAVWVDKDGRVLTSE